VTTDLNWQGAVGQTWIDTFDAAYKAHIEDSAKLDSSEITTEKPQIQAEVF
jgi:hypothetical protein